jgi:ferredoxin-NADP reductase
MLSAGIGITPMIAMLNSVLVNGSRTRHRHPIYFIHGAREVAHPFAVHLQTLAAGHNNLTVHVQRKRIDIDVLRELPKGRLRLLPVRSGRFHAIDVRRPARAARARAAHPPGIVRPVQPGAASQPSHQVA